MSALWVFLPVLGAYLAHAPVLTLRLFPALARPIDGGATWRGKPIFGENKTWRGLLVMFGGVAGLALALSLLPAYWSRLPEAIQAHHRAVFALLVGLGFAVAELPNSFLKRQLGIDPGTRRRSAVGVFFVLLDQSDFVFGIWLCLAPVWVMPLGQGGVVVLAATGIHLIINVIGYFIGARTTWI